MVCVCMCYLIGLPHLANASGLNEVWQHKGGLLNAPLALQVLPLLAPMPGHRHTVTVGLHDHQHCYSIRDTQLQCVIPNTQYFSV